jgi:2-polyprenyl-3-methyl-5-hydroxy-6-metoxy-1,4-benzoquinol methylase
MPDRATLPTSYFEAKYQADIDPWRFRTSDYEKQKYRATIGAMTKRRYRHGLEIGCSIGVLTAMLAARCDHILALDGSETAIREARSQPLCNVRYQLAFVPDEFPAGTFDLIVLSEILYYLSKPDLDELARRCMAALEPEGEIIMCHWLGETDYPLAGHQASDFFAAAVTGSLPNRAMLHEETYRLERLSG